MFAQADDMRKHGRQTAIADKWNLSRKLAGQMDENATNRPLTARGARRACSSRLPRTNGALRTQTLQR
jgi:hypothetical protein